MTWHPITTAPKDRKLDLWYVWWTARDDSFHGDRLANVRWSEIRQGWAPDTGTVPTNVKFTHWMEIPDAPEGMSRRKAT